MRRYCGAKMGKVGLLPDVLRHDFFFSTCASNKWTALSVGTNVLQATDTLDVEIDMNIIIIKAYIFITEKIRRSFSVVKCGRSILKAA